MGVGIKRYRMRDGTWTTYVLTDELKWSSKQDDLIRTFEDDPKLFNVSPFFARMGDKLYVAASYNDRRGKPFNNGIFSSFDLKTGEWTYLDVDDGSTVHPYTAIAATPGKIWLGTVCWAIQVDGTALSGLIEYDIASKVAHKYLVKDGLAGFNVFSIYPQGKNLWIGTNWGINQWVME